MTALYVILKNSVISLVLFSVTSSSFAEGFGLECTISVISVTVCNQYVSDILQEDAKNGTTLIIERMNAH